MNRTESLRIRDEIMEEVLEEVSENEYLSDEMAFQGGGALHFIYGSPRYSEDLDFVVPDLEEKGDRIEEELEDGIVVGDKTVRPEVKEKWGGQLMRFTYRTGENQPAGKLELFSQKSFDSEKAEGKYPVRTESLEEIYADKVVATFGRMDEHGSLKPTDLFDMDYMSRNFDLEVPEELIDKKADSYDLEDVMTEVARDEIVEYIEDEENHDHFREDIEDTLMPEVARNRDFDNDYFRNCAGYFQELELRKP